MLVSAGGLGPRCSILRTYVESPRRGFLAAFVCERCAEAAGCFRAGEVIDATLTFSSPFPTGSQDVPQRETNFQGLVSNLSFVEMDVFASAHSEAHRGQAEASTYTPSSHLPRLKIVTLTLVRSSCVVWRCVFLLQVCRCA